MGHAAGLDCLVARRIAGWTSGAGECRVPPIWPCKSPSKTSRGRDVNHTAPMLTELVSRFCVQTTGRELASIDPTIPIQLHGNFCKTARGCTVSKIGKSGSTRKTIGGWRSSLELLRLFTAQGLRQFL
jgi:hypothetical protein